MRALLVVAACIRAMLEHRGIEVHMIDLYADDFDTRLTGAERRGYFTTPYDSRSVAGYVAGSCWPRSWFFPQWWFNPLAILKGCFDRVLVPGARSSPVLLSLRPTSPPREARYMFIRFFFHYGVPRR